MRPISTFASLPALTDWHLGCALLGLGGSLLLPHPGWSLLTVGMLPLFFLLRCQPSSALCLFWLLVFFGLGGLQGALWIDRQLPESCLGEEVRIAGLIETLPEVEAFNEGQWRVTAEMRVTEWAAPDCGRPDRIRVFQYLGLEQLDNKLRYQHVVSGSWRLRSLPSQFNPGSLPDQARWASRGIDTAATAVGSIVQEDSGRQVAAFRTRLLADWGHQDGEGWSVMRALLLGDTRGLSDAAWRDLRQLGVIHVMVISGLHIGLLAMWCTGLLSLPRRCLRLRGDRGGTWLLSLGLLGVTGGYVLLVGAGLPVLRAYCMLLASQLPTVLGWSISGRRSLLIALVALAAMDPLILLGASFWLSAAATWLLIDTQAQHAGVAGLLRLQVKMVCLMAPITLFFFAEASMLGVISNLLIVPCVAWIMVPLGLFGITLFPWFPAAADHIWSVCVQCWHLLVIPMEWLLTCCVESAVVARPVTLWVFVLGVIAILCWTSRRRLAAVFWGAAVTVGLGPFSAPASGQVSIAILDVGQGLSVVIQAGRRTLVYDTGQAYPNGMSQAGKVLLPFLASRGVTKLDMLMISHGDQDHSGGYEAVVNRFPVHRLLGFRGDPCRHGERWRWGVAELLVINGPGSGESDRNDGSCALLVSWRDHAVLLTGDVSRARERAWVRYWRDTLQASVLLLPHHGSQTSTSHALLKWVRPEWAIISRGRGNPFRHPHDEVVDRVAKTELASLLDTAVHGAIELSDGEGGHLTARMRRTAYTPYWLKLP